MEWTDGRTVVNEQKMSEKYGMDGRTVVNEQKMSEKCVKKKAVL